MTHSCSVPASSSKADRIPSWQHTQISASPDALKVPSTPQQTHYFGTTAPLADPRTVCTEPHTAPSAHETRMTHTSAVT